MCVSLTLYSAGALVPVQSFECAACGSVAVTVPKELTTNALVACGRCNQTLCTGEFKEWAREITDRESKRRKVVTREQSGVTALG